MAMTSLSVLLAGFFFLLDFNGFCSRFLDF